MANDLEKTLKDALTLIGTHVSSDPGYQQTLQKLTAEWDALHVTLDSDAASKAEKDDAKRRVEALAKGLPAIATGLRDAALAFKRGDAISGSAAIVDICASVASTVGALASSAAGPPGALIGAVLSIVSMILRLFTAPQKSLTTQLEELIRGLASEQQIQNLCGAMQALASFRAAISTPGTRWEWERYAQLLNVIDGNAINKIRAAAEWIREPRNQSQPLWGQVLMAQCDAYNNLLVALVDAVASLDRSDRHGERAQAIANLNAEFRSNHAAQLAFLRGILPAARERGVHWHIGTWQNNTISRERYPDSGPLYAHDATTQVQLGGEQRILAVTNIKSDAPPDPYPYVAVFCLEPVWDHIKHRPTAPYRPNSRAYGLFGRWPLAHHTEWLELSRALNPPAPLVGLYDLCATPGDAPHEAYVYAALGDRVERLVHGGKHSEGEGLTLREGLRLAVPDGRTAGAVCAAARPLPVAEDDRARLEGAPWLAYAGCDIAPDRRALAGAYECHRHDFSAQKNDWHYITITALDERRYLWTNSAGVSWTLSRTDDPSRLEVGQDYPYKEHRTLTVVRGDDDEIVAVIGPYEERYERAGVHREIRAFIPSSDAPQATPTASHVLRAPLHRGEMTGLRCDRRRLWAFNQTSVACTTHASVLRFAAGELAAPRWLTYRVPEELIGWFYLDGDGRRVHDGLIDLAPCDDGTLLAVVSNTRDDSWRVVSQWHDNLVYTLTPRLDDAAGTFTVSGTTRDDFGHEIATHGWTQLPDIKAHRVLKQPLYCWPSLEAQLAALA
ncbi:MAG: hypothetical protein H6713_25740 [Myxococcales bacterium]|nr:hypothetical protein [Myxococcales bacterium]MCB9753358.1 hypothetical protein [Myxococcales bacterium]